jgi:Protein of unknown function, DUF624
MSSVSRAREFGEGPLARVAALVYTLLVVELLFLATAVPGLVVLVLLDQDASNIPLAAACALPVGPAFSAALYAMHYRRRDLADLHPGAAFWRGYRLNVWAVLRIWVPLLAFLTVVGVNLAHFEAAGVPGWWAVLLVIIAVVATLWALAAVVIVSLFEFRTTDVARLSTYFLVRTPLVALGNAGLLLASAGVVVASSEAVLALLAAPLAAAFLATCRPMVTVIQREFVQ